MRLTIVTAAVLASISPASAATLREALISTYTTNPDLTGARAQLRGIDEGVAIAKADSRLQVAGTLGLTQNYSDLGTLSNGGRALTGGVQFSYPLFAGGRVKNAVRAADARVIAGRANLRITEGNIFTQAVGAYMDVIRDTSIVSLNAGQVRVLETNFQASRDRFQVGDLTRTDVAQSQARLAGARSQLAAAQGQLTRSREAYRRIIGVWPADIAAPPALPALPATPDQAVDIALATAPALAAIGASVQAAQYDVRTAQAARLPTLSATTGANYSDYLGTLNKSLGVPSTVGLDNTQTNGSVGLAVRVPLYQGGGVGARVRQAQAVENQALEQGVGTERLVIATVRGAFASYQAAGETILSSEAAVSANQLALEGTKAENSVGSRSILDVLNAEQELLNSQVTLVTARRDQYVAGFALLNAMGRAEAAALNLDGGALYDPVKHYTRASRSMSDWRNESVDQPTATHTTGPTPIDTPPATAPEDVSPTPGAVPPSSVVTRPPN